MNRENEQWLIGSDRNGDGVVGGRKKGPVGFERVNSDRINDGDERERRRRDFSCDGSAVAIVLEVYSARAMSPTL